VNVLTFTGFFSTFFDTDVGVITMVSEGLMVLFNDWTLGAATTTLFSTSLTITFSTVFTKVGFISPSPISR